MKTLTLRLLFYVVFCSLLTAQAYAAPVIKSQAPCKVGTECFSFNSTDPIPVVRTFSFNAPSAGTGLLTFHGSMTCENLNPTASKVVDLVSQIVTDVNAVATATGPGGLRHAIRIQPDPVGNSDSFNLASTRVIKFNAAGTKTFFFKLASLRMDADTACFVYNATFSIVFLP